MFCRGRTFVRCWAVRYELNVSCHWHLVLRLPPLCESLPVDYGYPILLHSSGLFGFPKGMEFGTGFVRTCTLCAARGEQHDRLTHGYMPRKASLVLLSSQMAPLITSPPLSAAWSQSFSPFLLTLWQCRSLMFCCKKGRTLSTRASKISTASPLLLCTLIPSPISTLAS